MTPDEVRACRKRIGMSQSEMAKWLGVHRRSVENWETEMHKKNYRRISNEYAVKILTKRDEIVYAEREANRGV